MRSSISTLLPVAVSFIVGVLGTLLLRQGARFAHNSDGVGRITTVLAREVSSKQPAVRWAEIDTDAIIDGPSWPHTTTGSDALAGLSNSPFAHSSSPILLPSCGQYTSGQLAVAHPAPLTVEGDSDAPVAIPQDLQDRFLLGGVSAYQKEYYNDVSWGTGSAASRPYAAADVQGMVEAVRLQTRGGYEATDAALYELLARYPDLMRDKRVLVMGSVVPWFEAMAFAYGASEVLVVEYGLRSSDYPNLYFATPQGVSNCSLDFDIGMSVSSFEHDGLGRYGDPLNPEGDLLAMRVMKRLLTPGGLLLFASPLGVDTVVFNAHRVYGKYRWPMLTAGWAVLDYAGVANHVWSSSAAEHQQPIWLLQNTQMVAR